MRCSLLALLSLALIGRSLCSDGSATCFGDTCPSGSSLLQRNSQHRAKHLPTLDGSWQTDPEYLAYLASLEKEPPSSEGTQQNEPGFSSLLDNTAKLISFLGVPERIRNLLSSMPDQTLAQMILPGPYPCELQWVKDVRFAYDSYVTQDNGTVKFDRISLCGQNLLLDGMHPLKLTTANHYKNSVRLLYPLGAMPCCPTPPHCMAPACKAPNPYVAPPYANLMCTKSTPEAYYTYLTHPGIWPAYFFRGGSSDIDVVKHWDVLARMLGCYDNSTGHCKSVEPFDLSFDLGADWGSFTERFTARKFAKDFIMLDCVPVNKQASQTRFGNQTYLDHWYQEQVVDWPAGKAYPQFEFLSMAVSNVSEGVFDICDPSKTWGIKKADGSPAPPCPVPIMAMDDALPAKLSPAFQSKFTQAQSMYMKLDLDGMDQLGVDGMHRILNETRGSYDDGAPRYLVNFMMLEFCPTCIIETRQEKGYAKYDLGTLVTLYESLGFELFLIGPNYIPLSHGSWTEDYNKLFGNPWKCPDGVPFATYKEAACAGGASQPNCTLDNQCMQAADLFAMRSKHPYATEIKLALGSCAESVEFTLHDEQYVLPSND